MNDRSSDSNEWTWQMMMNIYENNDMRCIQYVTDDDDDDEDEDEDEDDAEDDEGGGFWISMHGWQRILMMVLMMM